MVSGLPSTQHIFLCSPSGNPPAVHAKESAEFYPAQSPLLTQMLASKPAAQSSSPTTGSLTPWSQVVPNQGLSFSAYSASIHCSPSCSDMKSYSSEAVWLQQHVRSSLQREESWSDSVGGVLRRAYTASGRGAVVYMK